MGVEEYFYGDLADPFLDDSITALERDEFAPLIQQLREGSMTADAVSQLPTLISHLEVRSRNLRGSVEAALTKLWNMTAERLQRPGVLPALFKARSNQAANPLLTSAREELKKQNLPPELGESLAHVTSMLLANSADEMFRPFWEAVTPVLKTFLAPALERFVKTAHQNALRKSVAPEVRADQYRHLRFKIETFPLDDLILGDSAVFFRVDAERSLKPFLDKDDEIVAVFLPLAANRVVVGSTLDAIDLSAAQVCSAAARTAHEFFIASKDSAANRELVAEIGCDSLPLTDAELADIVETVVSGEL